MPYRVSVHISPRRGILDPQGKAVEGALHSLGFEGVSSVRIGRHIVVDTDAPSEDAAIASVTAMCERLLANPVIEDFEIESATAS
jgi:phosphoribosylformylglycinamidine synthase